MTIGFILVGLIAAIALGFAIAGLLSRRALRAALLIAAAVMAGLAVGVSFITSQGDRTHACWDQGGEFINGRCVPSAPT